MLCTERRVKIRQIPDPRLPLHTYSNSYFHTCHTAPLHFAQSRKVSTNWSRAEELEEGEEGETKQNKTKWKCIDWSLKRLKNRNRNKKNWSVPLRAIYFYWQSLCGGKLKPTQWILTVKSKGINVNHNLWPHVRDLKSKLLGLCLQTKLGRSRFNYVPARPTANRWSSVIIDCFTQHRSHLSEWKRRS